MEVDAHPDLVGIVGEYIYHILPQWGACGKKNPKKTTTQQLEA